MYVTCVFVHMYVEGHVCVHVCALYYVGIMRYLCMYVQWCKKFFVVGGTENVVHINVGGAY